MIFLIVEGTLIWSLVKYRARRGGPEPAQIRGNTPLELGWTIGAALILVVLTVVTFVYLGDIKNPPAVGPGRARPQGVAGGLDRPAGPAAGRAARRSTIEVNGQQYLWRYDYPGGDALQLLRAGRADEHHGRARRSPPPTCIHSWWIPKLGGKADAVPATPTRPGSRSPRQALYKGQCAELCGSNHADMRAVVRAVHARASTRRFVERQQARHQGRAGGLAAQREQRERASGEGDE